MKKEKYYDLIRNESSLAEKVTQLIVEGHPIEAIEIVNGIAVVVKKERKWLGGVKKFLRVLCLTNRQRTP